MPTQPIMLKISLDQEEDGRWIAEIESLPGCLAYGADPKEAARRVVVLALNVLAEQLDQDPDGVDLARPVGWGVSFEALAA